MGWLFVCCLQLCHQLGVLVTFRSVCRQCGERQQGHPVVWHVIGWWCGDGDTEGDDGNGEDEEDDEVGHQLTDWLSWQLLVLPSASISCLRWQKKNCRQTSSAWSQQGFSKFFNRGRSNGQFSGQCLTNVCVCVCVCARVRVCVCGCVYINRIKSESYLSCFFF